MDYAFACNRKKKKDKLREKKKHPYKIGGRERTLDIKRHNSEDISSKNSDNNLKSKSKKKNKKRK